MKILFEQLSRLQWYFLQVFAVVQHVTSAICGAAVFVTSVEVTDRRGYRRPFLVG